jgi:hypothetical protein
MTLWLLMIWIAGAPAPLIYDAFEEREHCLKAASEWQESLPPNAIVGCPTIRLVRNG